MDHRKKEEKFVVFEMFREQFVVGGFVQISAFIFCIMIDNGGTKSSEIRNHPLLGCTKLSFTLQRQKMKKKTKVESHLVLATCQKLQISNFFVMNLVYVQLIFLFVVTKSEKL